MLKRTASGRVAAWNVLRKRERLLVLEISESIVCRRLYRKHEERAVTIDLEVILELSGDNRISVACATHVAEVMHHCVH
jgi:hypothetical protein